MEKLSELLGLRFADGALPVKHLGSSIKGNVKKNTPPLAGCFLAFQPT